MLKPSVSAQITQPPSGKLLNLSTRVNVGTGSEVAIGGFIIIGVAPKKVIIRGLGPSLSLPGSLADPTLELHKADGGVITNDNWKENQAEVDATQLAPMRDEESAIVVTLPPGPHTVILRGKNDESGIGLIEIYDLDPDSDSLLANLSTRGRVATESNVLIGGALTGGSAPSLVIVRAVGPSLTAKGVANALANPTLELVDRNGNVMAANDNWKDTSEALIRSSGLAPNDENEAAVVATLPPDSYTAVVRGSANTMGVALMEVYRLPDSIAEVVPPGGGTVEYPGVASAFFPAGSFAENRAVAISTSNDPETGTEFTDTAAIFDPGMRMPFEVRIKVGSSQPQLDVTVTFILPKAFRDAVPNDSEIRVFARNHWESEDEVLDTFELLPGRFLSSDQTATVIVPRYIFTAAGSTTGAFEAVLIVGTTPTRQSPMAISALGQPANGRTFISGESAQPPSADATIHTGDYQHFLRQAANGSECAINLSPPLDMLFVTSGYGLRILNGKPDFHDGTDFRASVGTPVRAMQTGIVKRVTIQRKDGVPKGYGQYVMISGTGGATTYGHLTIGSVTVSEGQMVNAGDVIALSGNSGPPGTPAHLHVDYAPKGDIFNTDNRIDPFPCIGATLTGSITVRDNGNLADDAFEVSLNGRVVCSTDIGQPNTCAVAGLRPGTATLGIRVVIAPDNVGTYEISLADRLTFSDGTTTRSGTLPEGGTASFQINIPNP